MGGLDRDFLGFYGLPRVVVSFTGFLPSFELGFLEFFSWFLWLSLCRCGFYWVFLPSFELGSSYRVFLGFAVCGSRLLLGFYRVYGWGNVDAIPSLHSPLSVAMVTGGGSP